MGGFCGAFVVGEEVGYCGVGVGGRGDGAGAGEEEGFFFGEGG